MILQKTLTRRITEDRTIDCGLARGIIWLVSYSRRRAKHRDSWDPDEVTPCTRFHPRFRGTV